MEPSIIDDLQASYGLTCKQITPVTGGLLNLKWKVSTEKGELLVKQYSPKRFRREQIERIESALRRQIILERNGVPCPFLWRCGDRIIRWLDDKTAYMVMDFRSGKTESPHTITLKQMHSLGSACAVMHSAFSRLPESKDLNLPVSGGYTMDSLWENLNSHIMQCPPDAHVDYRRSLIALEPILQQLSPGFFAKLPQGLAHEDLHSGNVLFDLEGVSAIVDFDRSCHSYIWHDIGRAILSFALEGNTLNVEKVQAFRAGYAQHLALTLANIADALRLSWCIETPWWIRPEFFGECDPIPKRFKEEMLWLTEHWFELDALLC